MTASTLAERANAKVNLVLRVGAPRADGMHPLCSLFAALELADDVRVEPGGAALDEVVCPGIDGENLTAAAVAAFRAAVPEVDLPPLRIAIDKRIPVAAGLAGGSADAAAVLRAANEIAGVPLTPDGLRAIAADLGSDVPSQVEPAHAIVTGVGERVERVHLPAMTIVLVVQEEGLSTAAVYGELDRLRRTAAAPEAGLGGPYAGTPALDPAPLRALAAAGSLTGLAAGLSNDLQPAALELRPDLSEPIAALRAAGALAARVTGSGPTTFGLFADRAAAERAAEAIGEPAIVTGLLA